MCSNLDGVQSTVVFGVMMVSAVIHRTSDTFVTFFHETQASFLIASQTENKTAAFFLCSACNDRCRSQTIAGLTIGCLVQP